MHRLLLLVVVLIALGCGTKDGYQLGGTITVDGKPVPAGHINFSPDRTKGNMGRRAMATIENGKISLGNHLVHGGPHKVQIYCFDGVPYKSDLQLITTGKEIAPPQIVELDLPMSDTEVAIVIEKSDGGSYQVKADVVN